MKIEYNNKILNRSNSINYWVSKIAIYVAIVSAICLGGSIIVTFVLHSSSRTMFFAIPMSLMIMIYGIICNKFATRVMDYGEEFISETNDKILNYKTLKEIYKENIIMYLIIIVIHGTDISRGFEDMSIMTILRIVWIVVPVIFSGYAFVNALMGLIDANKMQKKLGLEKKHRLSKLLNNFGLVALMLVTVYFTALGMTVFYSSVLFYQESPAAWEPGEYQESDIYSYDYNTTKEECSIWKYYWNGEADNRVIEIPEKYKGKKVIKLGKFRGSRKVESFSVALPEQYHNETPNEMENETYNELLELGIYETDGNLYTNPDEFNFSFEYKIIDIEFILKIPTTIEEIYLESNIWSPKYSEDGGLIFYHPVYSYE